MNEMTRIQELKTQGFTTQEAVDIESQEKDIIAESKADYEPNDYNERMCDMQRDEVY